MPIVKQSNAAPFARNAVVLDLGDLKRQAQDILDDAQADADRILADARAEADRLTADADERGHAEGHERGLREGRDEGRKQGVAEAVEEYREKLDQLVAIWSQAVQQWEDDRTCLFTEARTDVLRFALAMARRITLRVPEVDPTVVQDQVAEALAQLSRPSDVTIVVHPDDHQLVEDVLPDLVDRFAEAAHASLTTDDALTPGGCVVRTAAGAVDATLETQIDRIVEDLLPGAYVTDLPIQADEADPADADDRNDDA